MKRYLIVLMLLLTAHTTINAASGIFDRYVIMQQSGSPLYMSGSAFNNQNFGVFTSSQPFILTGGQLKTWKNGADDITAAFMYYRIYKATATILPGFDTLFLPWKEEVQSPFGSIDQTWENASFNQNILSGLSDGNYVIEVYFGASYTVNTVQGMHTDDNSGNNYKAYFTLDNCNFNLGSDMHFCSAFDLNLDAGSGFSTYLWNTGDTLQQISINQPGTYIVTVTNSFCSAADTIVISSGTSAFQLGIGPDTTLCGLGLVVLDAGAGFTSYQWSTGDTSVALNVNTAGTYAVTVSTSDNCLLMDAAVIHVNPLPFVDIGNNLTLCGGDSVVLDAGAGFASYLWSDNSINQSLLVQTQGTYSVTVTDTAGCQGFDLVTVSTAQIPEAAFSFVQQLGLEVAFTDLSQHSTQNYWDFMGNGSFTAHAPGNVTYTYPYAGSYNVRMVAANACASDTITIPVTVVTSLEELVSESLINLYPNPVKELLYVDMMDYSQGCRVVITNIQGQLMYSCVIEDSNPYLLPVGALPSGLYFLQAQTNKRFYLKSFIKE